MNKPPTYPAASNLDTGRRPNKKKSKDPWKEIDVATREFEKRIAKNGVPIFTLEECDPSVGCDTGDNKVAWELAAYYQQGDW